MPLPLETAETIAEKLYVLNPNLRIKVKTGNNEVAAITEQLTLNDEELKSLINIVDGHSISFSRVGGSVRLLIH